MVKFCGKDWGQGVFSLKFYLKTSPFACTPLVLACMRKFLLMEPTWFLSEKGRDTLWAEHLLCMQEAYIPSLELHWGWPPSSDPEAPRHCQMRAPLKKKKKTLKKELGHISVFLFLDSPFSCVDLIICPFATIWVPQLYCGFWNPVMWSLGGGSKGQTAPLIWWLAPPHIHTEHSCISPAGAPGHHHVQPQNKPEKLALSPVTFHVNLRISLCVSGKINRAGILIGVLNLNYCSERIGELVMSLMPLARSVDLELALHTFPCPDPVLTCSLDLYLSVSFYIKCKFCFFLICCGTFHLYMEMHGFWIFYLGSWASPVLWAHLVLFGLSPKDFLLY